MLSYHLCGFTELPASDKIQTFHSVDMKAINYHFGDTTITWIRKSPYTWVRSISIANSTNKRINDDNSN